MDSSNPDYNFQSSIFNLQFTFKGYETACATVQIQFNRDVLNMITGDKSG